MFLFLHHGSPHISLEYERPEFDFRAFNRKLGGLGLCWLSLGGALFYAVVQRSLVVRRERILSQFYRDLF